MYDFYFTDAKGMRIDLSSFVNLVKKMAVPEPLKEEPTAESIMEWTDFLLVLRKRVMTRIRNNKREAAGFLKILEGEDVDWLKNGEDQKIGSVARGDFLFSFSIDMVTYDVIQGIDINPCVTSDWALFTKLTR